MNLRLLLSNLYPENSNGGQCGSFARLKLADIPAVGDSYDQKKETVRKHGILASQLQGEIRIGDVIITSEGTNRKWEGNGHVAFVNYKVGKTGYLTESNFNKDEKIHHTRTIQLDSPKIYGVIRRPFKFKIPQTSPIELVVTVMMNHKKQWNGGVLDELADWVFKASDGKIKLKIAGLYTYNALKNWWYKAYGTSIGNKFYNVIDKGYFDEQAMPLRLPGSHIVLWCITPEQWHGSVFNGEVGEQEVGWYYLNTMPMQSTIVCGEHDKSIVHPHEKAFLHYAEHEISHWLYNFGNRRGVDLTHQDDFEFNDLGRVFKNLEWDYFLAQI